MHATEVRVVLKAALNDRGELNCLRPFVMWRPGDERIVLDGKFTALQLEAMATLMKSDGQK